METQAYGQPNGAFKRALIIGLAPSEVESRLDDIRHLLEKSPVKASKWEIVLSTADEITPKRLQKGDNLVISFPGIGGQLNRNKKLPTFDDASFDLIVSDYRSPELAPSETVRLLRNHGVAYFANYATLGGAKEVGREELELAAQGTAVRVFPFYAYFRSGNWPFPHPIEKPDPTSMTNDERWDWVHESRKRAKLKRYILRRM